ncbi:MAG TPA: glycosyltransferase family 4 protein [Acetobacteraceae bacterium]|nr:glycosyltransferase family 4 protein [Acetobacteraceae bacterium]
MAMIVLQVLPSLQAGGVEQSTVEITAAITAAGGRAIVASAGGRLVPAIERAGGRHVTLPLATKDPFRIWRNAAALADLVRAERVAIVHARSRAPAWSAWLAARRTGAHFVTTAHGVYAEDLPLKRRYNAVMAMGERVIANSRHVGDRLAQRHGVGPDRLRVIPRGVDPASFDPDAVDSARIARLASLWRLPDGAPVLLLPGRLTRWKGQALLLDAMARMQDRRTVAVLAGDAQGRHRYVASLERQAGALGLSPRVRLPGHCADMPAAMAAADLVVNASLLPEPFGRTIIEAQAMRRPVLAADHGGAAETIEPGATGWRFPPGDAAALACALDAALALPAHARAAVGARARAAVCAGYTTAAMQAATIAVYRELLDA